MNCIDMTGSLLSRYLAGDIYGIEKIQDDEDVNDQREFQQSLVQMISDISENKTCSLNAFGTYHDSVQYIEDDFNLNDELSDRCGNSCIDDDTSYENWLVGCLLDAALNDTEYVGLTDKFDSAVDSFSKELNKKKLFGKPKHDIKTFTERVIKQLDYIIHPDAELMDMLKDDDDERYRYLRDIEELKLRLSSNI